ncbi:uncharacterized protein [Argopecten irradians]|uniref:uncharacterized protein n=1 Tax=Argopecten irradians TaxID=31199 RepID=UPI0037240C10
MRFIDLLFLTRLLVQFLTSIAADDLVSSFLGHEALRCTDHPFMTIYSIGFIQCQRTCLRYSLCSILQYDKIQLKCFLYLSGSCEEGEAGTAIEPEPGFFIFRADIEEAIAGKCTNGRCPDNICIAGKTWAECFRGGYDVDVISSGNVLFVDIDGKMFGLVRYEKTKANAQKYCETTLSGTLAILDTPRKIEILDHEVNKLSESTLYWFVGAARSAEGKWVWDSGVPVTQVDVNDAGYVKCVILLYSSLNDHQCYLTEPFICELL